MDNNENIIDNECSAVRCDVGFLVAEDKAEEFNNLPPIEVDFSILDKLNIKRED